MKSEDKQHSLNLIYNVFWFRQYCLNRRRIATSLNPQPNLREWFSPLYNTIIFPAASVIFHLDLFFIRDIICKFQLLACGGLLTDWLTSWLNLPTKDDLQNNNNIFYIKKEDESWSVALASLAFEERMNISFRHLGKFAKSFQSLLHPWQMHHRTYILYFTVCPKVGASSHSRQLQMLYVVAS